MRRTALHYGEGVDPDEATIVIHGQREVDGLVLSGHAVGRIHFWNTDGSTDVYGPTDGREVDPATDRPLVVYRYAEYLPVRRSWPA